MSANPEKPGAIIIEGHIQGLSNTHSLGEAGIPVYVVDKNNCIARYSNYCKKFFYCPDFEKDEFALFLVELALEENISGWLLLPSNDHAVYMLSKHRRELEKHYKMITPEIGIIENIIDKTKLIDIANNCGVPAPLTWSVRTIGKLKDKPFSFPLITKGRFGLSFYKTMGKKAFFARNVKELELQYNLIQNKYSVEKCFSQELIPSNGKNNTLSFTAFCVKGEIMAYWVGEKIREHPLRFGTGTFARSKQSEECYELSTRLLKKLLYTGTCEIEYLLDPRDNQYKLIEMNARTWLWVELARACGIDFALMSYYHVNNQSHFFPESSDKTISWVNLWTDIPYSIISLLKGKLNPFNYIKSLGCKLKIAMWRPGDNKPFWMYPLLGFSFLFKR